MRSIEARLQKAEKAIKPRGEPMFLPAERRGDEIGITLPDSGQWISIEEARVSPKCTNVIVWDREQGPLVWRSKLKLCDVVALVYAKRQGIKRDAHSQFSAPEGPPEDS